MPIPASVRKHHGFENVRFPVVACLLLVGLTVAVRAQQTPYVLSKEYIRLGGQVIAIENNVTASQAASASLSAPNITFPTQTVNTASAPQTVTVSNVGGAAATIAGVSLGGPNAADFTFTSTCSGTIPAGSTCSVTVNSTPSIVGTETASLSISNSGSPSTLIISLSSTGTAANTASAGSPQSDSFSGASVNTSLWALSSATGGGSLSEGAGHLQIQVPAGVSTDAYTNGNNGIEAFQTVSNADFQVEAKFDSMPSSSSEGIMALQDASTFVRCDVVSNNDGVHPYSAFFSGANVSYANYASDIGTAASYWLRLQRSGSNWTCSVSTDGANYATVAAFSQTMTLNQLGLWSGSGAGNAFTAQVDYFSNGFTSGALTSGAPATDQFSANTVNTSVWTLSSATGSGSMGESSGHLQIQLSAGVSTDAYTAGNNGVEVFQTVANTDFQVEAKFDSTPSSSSEGIMALQDASNFIRCDVVSNNDGVHPFSAFVSGSNASYGNYAADIGTTASYWLRLQRSGSNWTCSVSTDGTTYSVISAFSQAFTLNKLGVWSGSYSGTAFTAQVDYFSNGFTSSQGAAGYANSKAITIHHALVPNLDQTNFPLLFSGTYPNLASTANGGGVQNTTGYDIIFASDAAGTQKLNFERTSYNPATGQVQFWVQLPTLSHTADTVIYLLYGNGSISTDQANPSATWSSNYKSVWHMDEASGTVLHDSTVNANNANKALANDPLPVAGEIGGAQQFTNNGNFAVTGASPSTDITSGGISISAVIFPDSNSDGYYGGIYRRSGSSSDNANGQVNLMVDNTYGDITYGVGSAQVTWPATNYVPVYNMDAWNFVTLTHDFSSNTVSLYLNGSLLSSKIIASSPVSAQSYIDILGNRAYGVGDNSFPGKLDEIRVAQGVLSPDWIATEYNNQTNPGSFYSVAN